MTSEAKALNAEGDSIDKIVLNRTLQYTKEHPGIVGYNLLVNYIRDEMQYRSGDITPAIEIYNDIYKSKFADHPNHIIIENHLTAYSIKIGNPYADVSATDSLGKEVKLSELINGKVTLLHLWASWCGPCRRHGKDMIPVYEKYKDKGFTVIGIARENNEETMIKAINQDKYPWVNLLELNDTHSIWTKFGVGNAGGGDFLIDKNGIFLAINTSPEEVEKILKELFD